MFIARQVLEETIRPIGGLSRRGRQIPHPHLPRGCGHSRVSLSIHNLPVDFD